MDTLCYRDDRDRKWAACGVCQRQVFTLAMFDLCGECWGKQERTQKLTLERTQAIETVVMLDQKLKALQQRYPGLVSRVSRKRLPQM